jgi:hypothetical protein
VAAGHGVPCRCALFKVEGLELGNTTGTCCIFQTNASHRLQCSNFLLELLGRRSLIICCLFILQSEFDLQLLNQLVTKLLKLVFIGLQSVVDLEERLHSLVVDRLLLWIGCELHVESDRHELERVLFVQVTEFLHHVEQVVLLGEQSVRFEVVDHLAPGLVVGHLC